MTERVDAGWIDNSEDVESGDCKPFLSVVIPAYNEELRLPSTLSGIRRYLEQQSYSWELIVVDDGSDDSTAQVVQIVASTCPQLYLITQAHRGKAAAVVTGISVSRGKNILFVDADASTPIEATEDLLSRRYAGYDIAIGSREGAAAKRVGEPGYRHLMGRGFNWIVRIVAVRGIKDTQCGFKMFSHTAAKAIFSNVRLYQSDRPVTGPLVSAFDVEVLFLARRAGMRIAEVPVVWTHSPGSKVRPALDSLRMLRDVLHVRWNAIRGRYN